MNRKDRKVRKGLLNSSFFEVFAFFALRFPC